MQSKRFRLRAPLACLLLLLSSGCAHRSTAASIARTERPTLPTPPAELTRTERLQPLAVAPAGALVTIDRGVLAELYERLAQAAAAIERGNMRIGGWKQLWRCTDAILRTGAPAPDCPKSN